MRRAQDHDCSRSKSRWRGVLLDPWPFRISHRCPSPARPQSCLGQRKSDPRRSKARDRRCGSVARSGWPATDPAFEAHFTSRGRYLDIPPWDTRSLPSQSKRAGPINRHPLVDRLSRRILLADDDPSKVRTAAKCSKMLQRLITSVCCAGGKLGDCTGQSTPHPWFRLEPLNVRVGSFASISRRLP
jgi:hypothetical protein